MRKAKSSRSLCLVLAGAVCLGACGPAESGDKGEEEGPLTGGKADSFIQPTKAGELRFGPQRALTFDDSSHYYELTFSLSGSAKVAVSTEIATPNLDSVLYLYHRAPGSGDWGQYLAKNDDAEAGSMASRIALEQAAAGEYRIIVKAFKLAMRGNLAVVGECTGPGCPKVGPGECNPDQITHQLPPETGYGPSCAVALARLLPSEVVAINVEEVTFAQRCQLSAIESKAVEFYHDYWNGLMGWSGFTGGEGGEARITVTHGALDSYQVSGDIVTVDLDTADEDAVTFVFDDDGSLVSALHIEQSSVNLWFCAKPGESGQGEPSTDCMDAALSTLPRNPDTAGEDTGSVRVRDLAEDDELPYIVRQMAYRYAQQLGLAGDEVIAFTAVEAEGWEGAGRGVLVELQAWEKPMVSYLLADDDSALTVILETVGGLPASFVCEAE